MFENRGNNLIGKWYLLLRSGTGPLFLENCLKKAVGKTAVCTAERKCFLVCGENPRMEKAILRMGWSIFSLEFAKCVKQFLLLGKLPCAVPNADKLPLKYSSKKKKFIGNRYMGSGWKRNLRKRKFIA